MSKNKLLSGFSVYMGTSIINKAIPFFLLPLMTAYLSPAEYGLLSVFQVFISVSQAVAGMGLSNNITRNFFKVNKERISIIISNLFIILLATSALLLMAIIIINLFIDSLFDISTKWLFLLPVFSLMNMVNEFNIIIYRNEKKPLLYGIFEISKSIVNISISMLLMIYLHYGWESRILGMVVASTLFGIISLIRVKNSGYVQVKISWLEIKGILKVSLPFIPHGIGGIVMTMSDRIFVNQMVGSYDVGLYTVGYQFGMIINIVLVAFNRTWAPWMYESLSSFNDELKRKVVKYTYYYGLLVAFLVIVISTLSRFVLPIMTGEKYHGASIFIIWIASGYAIHGLYLMIFPYSVYTGKTAFLGIVSFLSALFNLVANYILVSLNGSVGAAQATVLSYSLQFLFLFIYSHQIYPMPWVKVLLTRK